MGLLDFFGGIGKAGAAGPMTRLTSGLGQEGGLLSKFGLGGAPGAGAGASAGLGGLGEGGLMEFLQKLKGANRQDSPLAGDQGPSPTMPASPPGMQPTSLSAMINAYLQQQQRR